MKRLIPIGFACMLLGTPANASHTECTITVDGAMDAVTRPGGNYTPPRWHPLEQGERVSVLDHYRGWYFVHHWVEKTEQEYGWIIKGALEKCHTEDGTP